MIQAKKQQLTEREKKEITELRQQLQITRQSIEFMLKAYEKHNALKISNDNYIHDDIIFNELKKDCKKLTCNISKIKKGVWF